MGERRCGDSAAVLRVAPRALFALFALFAPLAMAYAPGVPQAARAQAPPQGQDAPGADDAREATVRFRPGVGLEVASADDAFLLNTQLRLQIASELRAPQRRAEQERLHLSLRRVRLTFSGHVFSRDVGYTLDLALGGQELVREPAAVVGRAGMPPISGAGMDVELTSQGNVLAQGPIMDAYIELTHLRDASVRIGQGKVPFGRELLLSGRRLQMVDRSLASDTFNFDRDLGIDVRSRDLGGLDLMRYYLGVYSGEDRNATPRSFGSGDLGLLYLVRFELFPWGLFNAELVDLQRTDPKLALGLAYVLLQSDALDAYAQRQLGETYGNPSSTPVVDTNSHHVTADALLRAHGFSALAAFHLRHVTSIAPAANGVGMTLMGGYFISAQLPLELAANVSLLRVLDAERSNLLERNEVGGGLNLYVFEHSFKAQAEYEHLWAQDLAGSALHRVRVQVQLTL